MKGFTVGYGGRMPADFTSLLGKQGVKTIVDVRLRPDKSAMGAYAKAKDADKGIAGLLTRAGIGYVSLPELGNMFMEYDDWPARYEKFLEVVGPLLFDRFAGIAGPICLMCAEKKVCDCHRRHVAEYLTKAKGWKFTHIE